MRTPSRPLLTSLAALALAACASTRHDSSSATASGSSSGGSPEASRRSTGPTREAATAPTPPPRDEPSRAASGEERPARETTPRESTHAADDSSPRADPRPPPPAKGGGVKAGAADDNLQFNAYLDFLKTNGGLGYPIAVDRRVVITVRDRDGRPVAAARVRLEAAGNTVDERRTYADGRTLLYERPGVANQRVKVEALGREASASLGQARRQITITLDAPRVVPGAVPLDVAFILDTTASMGEEIDRLKQTLTTIHYQITHLEPAPSVRFGMVLFKDQGDEYVTRVVPFTDDVAAFRASLDQVEAGGGGDTPEDVQAGLEQALHALKWRDDGVRLGFLIGDAPPHLDYDQQFNYVDAMTEAARRGIKIAAIGASGLPLSGEVVWREIAQYTMAPFVFLTHGETGDMEGSESSVSHHVGANWMSGELDAIVVKLVKVELAHLTERPASTGGDWFEAVYRPGSDSDGAIRELMRQSLQQLVDYAVEPIGDATPTVILPVAASDPKLSGRVSKIESRLELGVSVVRRFRLVERKDLGDVLRRLAAQLSEKYDDAKVVEAGKLTPARLAIIGRLSPASAKDRVELQLKLVRLETGEVLSVSLLQIETPLL